ncbi:MAG: TPM domain-containing protein [Sulfuritalea sp.]|nr:TPM domain-containing protein [Sulfuritalea sp.]
MQRFFLGLLTLFWLALPPAFGAADELVSLPALSSRITDLTATLDATQRGRLEAQLAALERRHGGQAAILLLPSTRPETIEQFGIRLAENWKIGHKGADNGVIVIVAKDDRTMRIEVGYGLEGAIPDVIAKRIIEDQMVPHFRQNDFFGGLAAAIAALDRAMGGSGEGIAETAAVSSGGDNGSLDSDPYPWLLAVVFGSGLLRRMFGLFGSLLAAVVAGGLVLAIMGSWLWAIIASVVVLLVSMLQLIPFGSGGFGGGFGGRGGGFGGGGGGFGGGGASGRW